MPKKNAGQDAFSCPLTGKPFRHPILASDGHHYELKALLERFNAGYDNIRVGGEAIFFASYDLPLRAEIDHRNPVNRYEEYDKQPYLEQLTEKLQSPYKPWKQDGYKAFLTADKIVLIVAALCLLNDCHAIAADSLLTLMLVSTVIDYAIRIRSGHQFGLGGLLQRIPTYVILFNQMIDSLDDDELESIMRL